MSLPFRTIFIFIALVMFCGAISAQQGADNKSLKLGPTETDDDDRPKNIKESLEKMRIEKDKKDHQEMIDRGAEAVKLADELQKSFADNGKLVDADLAKVTRVEKIVKKVRDELGGEGDDDDDQAVPVDLSTANTPLGNALALLKSRADTLYDELKKCTRFTISAAAIVSSNGVLKLARILRFVH